jgi:ATP-binding cassette subfamily B protein
VTATEAVTPEPFVEPETERSARFAWRLLKADPVTWLISASLWVAFFTLPLPAGLFLRAVVDQLPDGKGSSIWVFMGLLALCEIGRWCILLPAIVQWHGSFVFWHTVPRLNALASLVGDPGPVTDRLPGSPGEAVSRFRDDARDLAMVVDVWLDLTAAFAAAFVGLAILAAISPLAALAVASPVLVVLLLGQVLGTRLRRWRLAERQATAKVTGYIGDVFGSISAVKVSAAEQAVVERFEQLGHHRAAAARRDQVGTQLSQVLGGITANVGLGLALVLVAPAMRRGSLSSGDIALFTTYATTVGGVPRLTARWATLQRQGDVSAKRFARLMAGRDPDSASQPVPTHLRHGPPPLEPVVLPRPSERTGDDRLQRLAVRNLTVRLGEADEVGDVSFEVQRGELVVVTGPVGAGKSVLVRALLGLVPIDGGHVEWNGRAVADPSTWFVPPRAAYLPQVPRLFSEPLSDTVLLGLDPEALGRALTLACLDDDLAEMPAGRATLVGPKGVRLSGGQVQRTAAARALARRPELLVVDDLSSALDVATETRLWDGLFAVAGRDLTVLAISHRPRVLERADRIIQLQDGRIVDSA